MPRLSGARSASLVLSNEGNEKVDSQSGCSPTVLRFQATNCSAIASPYGMVLVTGPTGSGKSTTLAAMVNHKNETEEGHILTIEDPIEFLHPDQQATVSQREIGFAPVQIQGTRADVELEADVRVTGQQGVPLSHQHAGRHVVQGANDQIRRRHHAAHIEQAIRTWNQGRPSASR